MHEHMKFEVLILGRSCHFHVQGYRWSGNLWSETGLEVTQAIEPNTVGIRVTQQLEHMNVCVPCLKQRRSGNIATREGSVRGVGGSILVQDILREVQGITYWCSWVLCGIV